ncbi:hypothetical protein CYLTODRAFT_414266 [Cylindrobasidium torrendii FP15055 ss-10]|uniref:Uncharacterized protein n=1 Tax=Cylindrobasidium torrendii FP15055 ss-10 TaxID=1314674 RepID=A0A0D7AXZ3_9AGAR|nr:hypothetical protein CYLTODRAFT_414266 [Cylindrobasidium torrendii FP15055 ss-10]
MSATAVSTVAADKAIEESITNAVTVNKVTENVFDDAASTVIGNVTDSADSDVDSSSDERAKIDKVVDDLIVKAISTPCNSPKKTDDKVLPPSSPVRKTNLTAKSNASALKRQRSTESISEDFTKAKKPRRKAKASKKEALAKATEASTLESTIAATRSVPSDRKFVFEIGLKDEHRVLLFTKGKKDIRKTYNDTRRLTTNKKIFDLIGSVKAADIVLPEYFTEPRAGITKVFLLRGNQKLAMLHAHPYLTIRVLQQGLFDYAFHGTPNFIEGKKGGLILSRYECGMGCGYKTKKDGLVEHFKQCKELEKLNERIKKANEVEEEEGEQDLESEEEL